MDGGFGITLDQQADYRFEITFDGTPAPPLVTDEPAPLGGDAGPNPARLLAAAVANCLSASLLFALRKFRNEPGHLHTTAVTSLGRNKRNRMRVTAIDVEIRLGVAAAALQGADRALAQFEDFCVVTQSVRAAIPVTVRVRDVDGVVLAPPPANPLAVDAGGTP